MEQSGSAEQMAWIDARIQAAIDASSQNVDQKITAMLSRIETMVSAKGGKAESSAGESASKFEAESIDTPPSSQLTSRRKPLPTPPKFSGKRSEYAAWAQQMRDKINIDGPLYESDAALWYLINACLDTAPRQVVATFYAAGGPGGERKPAAFMQYLDRTYKDHNVKAKATASLRALHQPDEQAFASFLPKFERIMSEAGGEVWPDETKIAFLEGALNNRLKNSLVTISLPSEYFGWIERVQEVAWKVEKAGTQRNYNNAAVDRQPHKEHKESKERDTDGDVKMTGVNAARANRKRYDSDASSGAEEVKETRKCFSCGKPGHLIRDCRSKKKANKKPSVNKTAKKGSKADTQTDRVEVVTTSESEVSDESEKE
jgi:zinc knuckle protein